MKKKAKTSKATLKKATPKIALGEAMEEEITRRYCQTITDEVRDTIRSAEVHIDSAIALLKDLSRSYGMNIEAAATMRTDSKLLVDIKFEIFPELLHKKHKKVAVKKFIENYEREQR